jgi:hypothetical protein
MAMRKTNTPNRKIMKLETTTVRVLGNESLTTVAGGFVTVNWSCCGACTHSGFISCVNTSLVN